MILLPIGIVIAIILGWYSIPMLEREQITDHYYEGVYFGSYTDSEYEKLQQDTYRKYLEYGEQTNSEVLFYDVMPTIYLYYNCTQEQWYNWHMTSSVSMLDYLDNGFDGGCFISIYYIIDEY